MFESYVDFLLCLLGAVIVLGLVWRLREKINEGVKNDDEKK